ncbi:Protein TCP17 [Diplonema papillatum]|nr:Protein TCP17 [Diplonema papillatum]
MMHRMFIRAASRHALGPQLRFSSGGVSVEKKLEDLGEVLPPAPKPGGSFVPFARTGNLVYVSGQVPKRADGTLTHTGVVGKDLTVEEGAAAARVVALNLIAQMKAACDGDLRRVRKIVKVEGFVGADVSFAQHPKVINGCSDLLTEVFGPQVGPHTRFAVGVSSLPLGVPVEISCIFEIAP